MEKLSDKIMRLKTRSDAISPRYPETNMEYDLMHATYPLYLLATRSFFPLFQVPESRTMRRAARRDANEAQIVEALEYAGATVARLNEKDIPYLLVGFRGDDYLLEVKDGYNKLSPGQKAFHAHWRGKTIAVVRSVEDALEAIGAI